MKRTGIITKYRQCPRHGTDLEADVVDDADAASYLRWWCGDCGGSWSERYFTMRVEAALPVMALTRRFRFPCPHCRSFRTCRACNIDCCDCHHCRDCDQYFTIDYEITSRTSLAAEKVEALKSKSWLEGCGWISAADDGQFEHHNEAIVISPCCEEHPDSPVTLAIDPSPYDERYRFGWFCKACNTVKYDYLHAYPRGHTSFFSLEEQADFRCRVCHHCEFDQTEDLGEATCTACGTSFRLTGSPQPKP